MKKCLLLLYLVLIPIFISAQNRDYGYTYREYTQNNVYGQDGSEIYVSRVIDNLSGNKDEIYIKVKDFFTRNYNNANSVIQTDAKEAGTIIGKGIFRRFWNCRYMAVQTLDWSAYHVMRVDIKEGRIRVICSTNTMEYLFTASTPEKKYTYNIIDYAPFTDKRMLDKGKQTEAFVRLVDVMHWTIDNLEKTVREGSLSIESQDW